MIDRRLLLPAAAATAAIGLALVFAGVMWSERAAQSSALEGTLALYDRYRAIAGFEPRLPALQENRMQDAGSNLFMARGTPAEVSASLASLLNQIAQNNGVQVLRSNDAKPRDAQAIALISTEVEITGQLAAIYGLIQAIEASRPLLVIERFAVRSSGLQQTPATEEQPVVAILTVYAAIARSESLALQGPPP